MWRNSKLKVGLLAAGLPVTAWLAAAAMLYFRQEKLIFHGEPRAADSKLNSDWPADDVRIEVPGATLHGLHFRHDKPRGLVFFLHGNCGDVVDWSPGSDLMRRTGFDLFMFDYRGFGWSTGRIDSEVLLTLARKAELMRIDGAEHGNIHEFPAYLHGLETKLKQVGAALS